MPECNTLKVVLLDGSQQAFGSISRKVAEWALAKLRCDLAIVDLSITRRKLVDEALHLIDIVNGRQAEGTWHPFWDFERADVLLLGAPCYNGSISWPLKLYIDVGLVAGETVATPGLPARIPVRVRHAIIVSAYGGPARFVDDVDPHIAALNYALRRVGVPEVSHIAVRNTAGIDDFEVAEDEELVRSIDTAVSACIGTLGLISMPNGQCCNAQQV